jgi:excinuclease ABC subunit B
MGIQKPEEERSRFYSGPDKVDVAADPVVKYMSEEALKKAIDNTRKAMEKAAKQLDFIEAARLRDEMYDYQKLLNKQL